MTRDATGAATRVGLSSYHRMKQRAEIAEAEERRLCGEVEARDELLGIANGTTDMAQLRANRAQDEVTKLRRENLRLECEKLERSPGRCSHRTWRHDLGTVVGGVLLAAGLIAAIVWGIYG